MRSFGLWDTAHKSGPLKVVEEAKSHSMKSRRLEDRSIILAANTCWKRSMFSHQEKLGKDAAKRLLSRRLPKACLKAKFFLNALKENTLQEQERVKGEKTVR